MYSISNIRYDATDFLFVRGKIACYALKHPVISDILHKEQYVLSHEYLNLGRQDQQLCYYDGGAEHLEAVLKLDQPKDPSAAGLAGDLEVPAHVGGQREAEGEADGARGGERLLVGEQQLHRVVVRHCKASRSDSRKISCFL